VIGRDDEDVFSRRPAPSLPPLPATGNFEVPFADGARGRLGSDAPARCAAAPPPVEPLPASPTLSCRRSVVAARQSPRPGLSLAHRFVVAIASELLLMGLGDIAGSSSGRARRRAGGDHGRFPDPRPSLRRAPPTLRPKDVLPPNIHLGATGGRRRAGADWCPPSPRRLRAAASAIRQPTGGGGAFVTAHVGGFTPQR